MKFSSDNNEMARVSYCLLVFHLILTCITSYNKEITLMKSICRLYSSG